MSNNNFHNSIDKVLYYYIDSYNYYEYNNISIYSYILLFTILNIILLYSYIVYYYI